MLHLNVQTELIFAKQVPVRDSLSIHTMLYERYSCRFTIEYGMRILCSREKIKRRASIVQYLQGFTGQNDTSSNGNEEIRVLNKPGGNVHTPTYTHKVPTHMLRISCTHRAGLVL